jgi:MFS family permease
MTAGSVLGVVAVLAWSQVHTIGQLYLVFALIGLASAGSLYEAAFAVVIAATEPGRRNRAVLAVTIVAGFASSIFFPLTGRLLGAYGWRTTLIVLAGVLATTAIPGHLWAVPARHTHHAGTHHRTGTPVREALRDHRFWVLTVAFVAHSAAVSAVGVLLVAYLRHAGHSATAAACAVRELGFGYAACSYSLISPCSTFLLRTRTAPRSTGAGSASRSGGRCPRPWCGRCPL